MIHAGLSLQLLNVGIASYPVLICHIFTRVLFIYVVRLWVYEQSAGVRAMVFNPDGRIILTAMQDSLKVISNVILCMLY
jgi:hypothetical protein